MCLIHGVNENIYYVYMLINTRARATLYSVSHFKQANRISRKLSPADNNVSGKIYRILRKKKTVTVNFNYGYMEILVF